MSRNDLPSDEQLFTECKRMGVPQFVAASRSGFSEAVYSQAKTRKHPLNPKQRSRLATTVLRFKEIEAKHPGIPIDWSRDAWVDDELAKLKGGNLPVIPQTHGSHYIHEFAALIELGDDGAARFVACVQMSPQAINAPIFSLAAQEWVGLWADAMQEVLEHRGYREFVTKNGGDDRKSLTLLANQALEKILAKVGRERVFGLMAALLRSGELKAASAAGAGKN